MTMKNRSTNTRVVSLVEKGWAGARRFSIELVQQGMTVEHVVKGRVPPEVLEIVTPYPGMRVASYSRRWYRLVAWLILARAACRRRLAMVIVDNRRTVAWVAAWFPMLRDTIVLIQEQQDGSPVVIRHPVAGDRG